MQRLLLGIYRLLRSSVLFSPLSSRVYGRTIALPAAEPSLWNTGLWARHILQRSGTALASFTASLLFLTAGPAIAEQTIVRYGESSHTRAPAAQCGSTSCNALHHSYRLEKAHLQRFSPSLLVLLSACNASQSC